MNMRITKEDLIRQAHTSLNPLQDQLDFLDQVDSQLNPEKVNPYRFLRDSQKVHNEVVKKQDLQLRRLRDDELALLREKYKELKEAHHKNAWYSVFGILGAVLKTFAAGFDQNDTKGKVLMGAGSFCEHSQSFLRSWNEGNIAFTQGTVEIIRTHLSEIDTQNNELSALLRDMNSILEDAKNRVVRAHEMAVRGQ